MLQIKTFEGTPKEIDEAVNEFLDGIDDDLIRSIEVKVGFAVVQYHVKKPWEGRLCSECQHWDDAGSSDSVIGLCQEKGGRRRFNCRACDKYKDIRA